MAHAAVTASGEPPIPNKMSTPLSSFAVAIAPCSCPCSLAGTWATVAVGLQVAFYAVAVAGRRLESRFGRLAYVPRFLVDSNLAALRGLWRHVTGSQSALWARAERRAL